MKPEIYMVKINFNSKFLSDDDESLDAQINRLQAEWSTELFDYDQAMNFYQLGKVFEKKMKNCLFQAVDILREINPGEAELIIKKYNHITIK